MSGKVQEMPLRKAAVAAFFAMCVTNIVSTAMVIFESRYSLVAAGVCDVLAYLSGLVCSVLALDSILRDGWRSRRSQVLVLVVSLANFVGTALGVLIVQHLSHA